MVHANTQRLPPRMAHITPERLPSYLHRQVDPEMILNRMCRLTPRILLLIRTQTSSPVTVPCLPNRISSADLRPVEYEDQHQASKVHRIETQNPCSRGEMRTCPAVFDR